jgi:hypothetical protein
VRLFSIVDYVNTFMFVVVCLVVSFIVQNHVNIWLTLLSCLSLPIEMMDCFESSSFPQLVRQRTIKYLDIFPNLDIRV